MAEVRLGVGVEPWTYKQPLAPTSYRSTGPHTVVLQVVEGAAPAASKRPHYHKHMAPRWRLCNAAPPPARRPAERHARRRPRAKLHSSTPPAHALRRPGVAPPFNSCTAARYLGGPQPTAIPAASNNPFIQLQYDQATYGTAVAYGTTSPVFLETFAFAENASMLTRRVRLEAWSAPPAVAARGGGGTPGASFLSTDGGGERRECERAPARAPAAAWAFGGLACLLPCGGRARLATRNSTTACTIHSKPIPT